MVIGCRKTPWGAGFTMAKVSPYISGIVIIFALVFLFPRYLSARLTEREYDMIKDAFINGYARALSLDVERIRSLKGNIPDMRKFVMSEAEKYMEEVLELNKSLWQ